MTAMEKMYEIDKLRIVNMEHYGFGPVSMKKQKVCRQCGAISSAEQQFCKECGHRLPKDTMYHIYRQMHPSCPCCDTVLSKQMVYCPKCGTKINQGIKVQVQQ